MMNANSCRKPLIGLIPLVDIGRESLWMLPGYMEGIRLAGGIPVMLPLTDDDREIGQIAEQMDGFLFTGGHDVSPEVYGEETLSVCGELCPQRDRMEEKLLKKVLSADKPALGICRGIQLINAAMGGTLYQDLSTQHPSAIEHHQTPPYDKVAHEVQIEKGTPLHALLGMERLGVNSYHHQGIKRLAPDLKVMAKADDGMIEGVYCPERRFLWAVQWHPEFSYRTDENSRKIFGAFVKSS